MSNDDWKTRDLVTELQDAGAGAATCLCDVPRCNCGASVELLHAAAEEIKRLRSLAGAVSPGQSAANIKEGLRAMPRAVSTTSASYFKDQGPQ